MPYHQSLRVAPAAAREPKRSRAGRASAGMAACAALLDAFDAERTALERRAAMLNALELAMGVTGRSPDDAVAMLAQWCRELR